MRCERKGCNNKVERGDWVHLCVPFNHGYKGEYYLCQEHFTELVMQYDKSIKWFAERLELGDKGY